MVDDVDVAEEVDVVEGVDVIVAPGRKKRDGIKIARNQPKPSGAWWAQDEQIRTDIVELATP